MAFELWDLDSENIVGRYETETEALEVVYRSIQRHGAEYVALWELIRDASNGDMVTIAMGSDLADLGLSVASALGGPLPAEDSSIRRARPA